MVTIHSRFVPSSSLRYAQDKFEPFLFEVYVSYIHQLYLRDSADMMASKCPGVRYPKEKSPPLGDLGGGKMTDLISALRCHPGYGTQITLIWRISTDYFLIALHTLISSIRIISVPTNTYPGRFLGYALQKITPKQLNK